MKLLQQPDHWQARSDLLQQQAHEQMSIDRTRRRILDTLEEAMIDRQRIREDREEPDVSEGAFLLLSEQYLPLKGGHIVLMHELCRRLGPTRVLTGTVPGAPPREVLDGLDVRRIPLERAWYLRPESLAIYVRLFWAASRLIRKRRPRVALAARALPEGLVAKALNRAFGVPTVVFAHGEEISPWTGSAPVPLLRKATTTMKKRCLWEAYRQASAIVANSGFTRDLLVGGGVPPGKVTVVNPGTDPQRYHPMPPNRGLIAELGLEGKRVLLTVGRLTPRKGQDMVLRAMPRVLRAFPDTVYLIAGTGVAEPDLREIVRTLALEGCVRFLGDVPPSALPDLYNLCDVFLMPNRVTERLRDLEGFGIVFLEAGACGKPVIGGRTGGVPDAVEDGRTGLLVDGTSSAEVAQAAIRLLGDANLARRLGEEGRRRVCRDFMWDAVARRVRDLIDGLKAVPSLGR